MVRVARQPDPARIRLLKRQINDDRYLNEAIRRIAQELTKELVERDGGRNGIRERKQ